MSCLVFRADLICQATSHNFLQFVFKLCCYTPVAGIHVRGPIASSSTYVTPPYQYVPVSRLLLSCCLWFLYLTFVFRLLFCHWSVCWFICFNWFKCCYVGLNGIIFVLLKTVRWPMWYLNPIDLDSLVKLSYLLLYSSSLRDSVFMNPAVRLFTIIHWFVPHRTNIICYLNQL